MRYLGNKTKLLAFIRRVLRSRGIRGGLAVDPFTGTASVARELKRLGFRVVASDVMAYGYVFARAYVQVAEVPEVGGVRDVAGAARRGMRGVVAWLDGLSGEPGFVHRHFTPEGDVGAAHGRMYFTPENAARIDAIRGTIERWRDDAQIDDDAYHLLLASLIEAADAVANTAGVYASFIKSWQANAVRPLRLRVPRIIAGNGCRAVHAEASALLPTLGPFELLYVDPPYNTRQYPGYYHIPELLAEGWFREKPRLRGKTGLAPDAEKRSDWARRARCEGALVKLLAAADCRHVVMSYNSEGIIPADAIARTLKEWGRRRTYRVYRRRGYKRYRADSDGDGRQYSGDQVEERLYCVSR